MAKSTAKDVPKIEKFTPKTLKKLRLFNLIAALLLAAQAVAIPLLAGAGKGSVPIITDFLTEDILASDAAGSQILVQGSTHLFDINLAYLVSAFLAAGAIGCLMVATLLRKSYEMNLKKNLNPYRWVQYTVGIGLLLVTVGLLVGIQEIALLKAVFAFALIANVLRIFSDSQNQDRSNLKWSNYWLAVFAGLINFVIFAIYAWGANVYGSDLSSYTYGILGVVLASFILINAALKLNYKARGRWACYLHLEKFYIILSLIATSAVAWLIFVDKLQ